MSESFVRHRQNATFCDETGVKNLCSLQMFIQNFANLKETVKIFQQSHEKLGIALKILNFDISGFNIKWGSLKN